MRTATKYVPDYNFIDFVCDQSFFARVCFGSGIVFWLWCGLLEGGIEKLSVCFVNLRHIGCSLGVVDELLMCGWQRGLA